MAIEGLTTISSKSDSADIVRKLEAEIQKRGLTIFARIDHAAGAAEAGMALRPTQLLIFGNAKSGTPLMQQAQTIGIDLPLKFLVWQDEAGVTKISYSRPDWIAGRHGVQSQKITDTMQAALASIAQAVT